MGFAAQLGKPTRSLEIEKPEHHGLRRHAKKTDAARAGGVAILARAPQPLLPTVKRTRHMDDLIQPGRWVEAFIPSSRGDTKRGLLLASVYGFSGANEDAELRKDTEDLWASAMEVAASAGQQPYIIAMDLNMDIVNSRVLTAALATEGWWEAMQGAANEEDMNPRPSAT